jgi:EAL domain-containing protein (putative c-di-GMP-specific phosphodiesterase class I)
VNPGTLARALEAVREHLGMRVAYVSEFVGDRAVFRAVDAPGLEHLIKPGDSVSLDDVYCRHILAGRLPELIRDTAEEPIAASLPITAATPIGSHISVPVQLSDGTAYGMFCCLSPEASPSLNERDLQVLRVFADLAAYEIEREVEARKDGEEKSARILGVIDNDAFSIVYQPIWDLDAQMPVGLECLSRFAPTPTRPPDVWFGEAAEVGLAVALEIATIRAAVSSLPAFPADIYLAVNTSPATILSGQLEGIVDALPPQRLVIEVTEHAPVEDYAALTGALQRFRARGIRLAVDDAGSGYSSLQHILQLQPDLIKLDTSLTRHIDSDPARRALASALIGFAYETRSRIIAEGVETASELAVLRALGIKKAQGYHLSRPLPLDRAVALFHPPGEAARVA